MTKLFERIPVLFDVADLDKLPTIPLAERRSAIYSERRSAPRAEAPGRRWSDSIEASLFWGSIYSRETRGKE